MSANDENNRIEVETEDKNKGKKSNLRKVSKRKIIYIEIDDEITSVYSRVRDLKMDEVYIVVPHRAVLLESVLNLKILKKKLEEINKKLFIITNDPSGIKLAKQAEVPVFDKIEHGIDLNRVEPVDSPKIRISPLKAVKNVFYDDNPKRLSEKKISINDIIKSGNHKDSKSKFFSKLSTHILNRKEKVNDKPKVKRFSALKMHKGAIGILIPASFFLLLIISYIALPGATLILSPSSNVIEKSINITIADKDKNAAELNSRPQNMIAGYIVNAAAPMKVNIVYNATGNIFKGENSHGFITIHNKRNTSWDLMATTRFQTQDGLIFRIKKPLTVPRGSEENPGKIEAEVFADEYDIYGKPIGERGNIGPTNFFLPGLKEDSRTTLYAQSSSNMTGGISQAIKIITKEDLEASKKKAEEEIYKAIIPNLQKTVEELNKTQGLDYELLTEQNIDWQRAVKFSEPKIFVPFELEGKQQETFEVSAEIEARGIAYKRSELIDILKSELKLRKSPEKKLVNIEENTVTYRLFEENTEKDKYKITATIKGVEEYIINPDDENGARLIKKIKEHILGKDIKDALDYLQNLPEIHKAEIKTWPIWAPTIPNVMDNVKVELTE